MDNSTVLSPPRPSSSTSRLDGIMSSSASEQSTPLSEGSETTATSINDEDPVCIVGIGCRLPGSVNSTSRLWDFLTHQKSGQGTVPPERFNAKGFYRAKCQRRGVMNADGGYFIQEDIRQFDNAFFGINNLEATHMDPQQRKLLEVVYECLENSGVSMDAISGTNTGVYVGNFTIDHQVKQTRDLDYMHRYNATGGGATIMSNRVSHVFNLQGPSLTLDTACSSSLYGLHAAVSALKSGDCDGAIVAGANIINGPEQHYMTLKAGVLSPSSTCHTFDASANGYGRADGVNAVYLKRLSHALRDNDTIRAVVRGTATNSNGRTPGITKPSSELQEAVIRKAYSSANIDFLDTDYIECHGTGTAVGDPIEVDGLARCFGPGRESPLMIGSVKTNFGHSEAASGLTSIIKVCLAFEHGLLPPTRGVNKLNPKLNLDNMEVLTETKPWPRSIRRASINSFGYGGANAHAILESIDSYLVGADYGLPPSISLESRFTGRTVMLPVSATSNRSLDVRMEQIRQALAKSSPRSLRKLAFTLGERRTKFPVRGFLLARATEDAVTTLTTPTADLEPSSQSLPFAFVFTGQGAQYAGMGKELLCSNDTFDATIRGLDAVLRGLPADLAPTWTLEKTILDPPEISQINHVTRSQPVCTAIQIALVNVLRTWDVDPSAVVGHSSGEIAAAYAAGLLTSAQAILTAYFRGYAVDTLKSEGAMMAAGLDRETAQDLISKQGLQDQVVVACVNAPGSVTLSGSTGGIDTLLSDLQGDKIFCRKLHTGGRAYHSHMMQEVGDLYENLLAEHVFWRKTCHIKFPSTQWFSSVGWHGQKLISPSELINPARYWRENLEKPVQFNDAVGNLAATGKYQLIEIGPHSALKGPIQQIRTTLGLERSALSYAPTLVRNEDADVCLKTLAGSLFVKSHSLNICNVNEISEASMTPLHDLEPYPWDYSAGLLWHESRPSMELRNRKHLHHELLGARQVAGNDIDWAWRNVLHLADAPWLRDHKVDGQVVFPAAGYMALAMEALSQIRDIEDIPRNQQLAFEFSNVNIKAAMVIPEHDENSANEVEIHTTLSSRKLSTVSASTEWYDFAVSSWANEQAALHCAGSIRITGAAGFAEDSKVPDASNFEKWPMDRWYEALWDQGIHFGQHFKSLQTVRVDGNRTRADAIATSQLMPRVGEESSTNYAIHPITVDACLQSAIIAGSKGDIHAVRAYLPQFISECRIRIPRSAATDCEVSLHVRSTQTGVSNRQMSCTLEDPTGLPLVEFKNVRMGLYSNNVVQESSNLPMDRHPCLRVHWKPDILRLGPETEGQLQSYVDDFVADLSYHVPDLAEDEVSARIGAIIDLMGHKNPRMDILELGSGCDCKKKHFLQILGQDTTFPRYRSWKTGMLAGEDGKNNIEDSEGPFNLVVIPTHTASKISWREAAEKLVALVADNGVVITRKTDNAAAVLETSGFRVIDIGKQTLLAIRSAAKNSLVGREVLFVFRESSPAIDSLISSVGAYLKDVVRVSQVSSVSIAEIRTVNLHEDTLCISLLEMEREYLATMTQQDMDLLVSITNVAKDILWLNGANMLNEPNPDLTLSGGLARSLMLEQPSLRFSILDIGPANQAGAKIRDIGQDVVKSLASHYYKDDREFISMNGLLYISRFGPDTRNNSTFQRRAGTLEESIRKLPLSSASPARLAIGKVGVTDSLHFQELCEPSTELPEGFIDVEVKAFGINAKDVYGMSGRVETLNATTSLEFSGIIKSIGPGDVQGLAIGDRVVVMAPNHLSTSARVPAWSAQKLLPDEDFGMMATLPVAYATALFAFYDRARLRADESVLIHSGAGALGMAAITIAQRIGATVYTTVGSQAKRDFVERELGVPSSHIFNSRDESFAADVKAATKGRGVDVVLNSLTGDLMHTSWACIAKFGRFIEVGKRELVDAGKLDMHKFLGNTTFTAFDLSELYYADDQYYRDIWIDKIKQVVELYRAGEIKPGPIAKFDAGNVSQAYRYFSSRDRIGKIVLSLENPNSLIPTAPPKHQAVFSSDKVYLLVGCLGGLGRSLSRWMMARGARNFVFLGRSGTDRPQAKKLVELLQDNGASVTVVRGDVCKGDDVMRAVTACEATGKAIGGVIQGAMGLHEAIFSRMTSEMWHTGIQPKWAGSWNLHHALEGHDAALDFFLLMSSVSGSIGIATETNYCASNGFLDAFAHWRRCQGKPATSVGLGMIAEVGYLHENPEIEAILLRRGIQALNEPEFLNILDLALSGPQNNESESREAEPLTGPAAAHILTGLELFSVFKLMDQGFEVNHTTMDDPRASLLSAALEAGQEARARKRREAIGDDVHRAASDVGWMKSLPGSVTPLFKAEVDASSLGAAALRLIKKQFSNLILMPQDKIDDKKPLAGFGVDSMIASEFRTWFWGSLKVDIPFLDLLSQNKSLSDLAAAVEASLSKA